MVEDRAQFQCMNCGYLHWLENPPNIDEDDLYIKMACKHCKTITNHLWVGNREEDKYIYYDVTKDSRYFL